MLRLNKIFLSGFLLLLLISGMPLSTVFAAPHADDHLTLLVSFAWLGDSVGANIEQSFRYATTRSALPLPVDIVHAGSAYEAAAACDTLMKKDGLRLLVFAGDEGSAAVVAMKSAEFKVPVLKLTNDYRSLTALSPLLVDFLPSTDAQGRCLAEFAARTLGIAGSLVLCPDDARGRASMDGFRAGLRESKKLLESAKYYPTDAVSIRSEVEALFADTVRLSLGGVKVESALTNEERAEMFGDSQRGEVLFGAGSADSTAAEADKAREGFFFSIASDKIDAYAKQLPAMPEGTVLLGNSSWMDMDALNRQLNVTDDMYIVVPLLPVTSDTSEFFRGYQATKNHPATPWELLGLDAGEFVGQVFAKQPKSRADVVKSIVGLTYTGRAVAVDFGDGHENRKARIMRFDGGNLITIE